VLGRLHLRRHLLEGLEDETDFLDDRVVRVDWGFLPEIP